jgi:hypothetical protein
MGGNGAETSRPGTVCHWLGWPVAAGVQVGCWQAWGSSSGKFSETFNS